MTDTRAMLEAAPNRVQADVGRVAAAIDGCLNCLQTCTSCADSDLAEHDIDELRACIALCLNCADVCDVTARALSRPSNWETPVVHRLLQACVRSCTSSAEECARHATHHRHCDICEQACRVCLQACAALLDAEPFRQL